MTEGTENLILEHLRALRAGQDPMVDELAQLRARVSSVETSVAHLHVDLAGVNVRLDRLSERVERVEKRLEIVPAS